MSEFWTQRFQRITRLPHLLPYWLAPVVMAGGENAMARNLLEGGWALSALRAASPLSAISARAAKRHGVAWRRRRAARSSS